MSAEPEPNNQPAPRADETPEGAPNRGRFQKGCSGNNRGRPRGSGKRARSGSAFEVLLNKTLMGDRQRVRAS